MVNRRHFLALLGMAAAAGGVLPARLAFEAGAAPQTDPDVRRQAFAIALPGLARDGAGLTISLSHDAVFQGGAFRVSASGGMSGTVSALGQSVALNPFGDGLAAYLGVGTEYPPGLAAVTIVVEAQSGIETFERTIEVNETEWTVAYIDLPPGTGGLLDPTIVLNELKLLQATYAGLTARMWEEPWRAPVLPPLDTDISSYFGEQRSFNGGTPTGHHGGTDFNANAGTPVLSVNHGTVVLARALDVRGNMVIVDHGGGVFSGYAHLSAIAVSEGQAVARGAYLGDVGSTGLSTGPHLHWEMVVGGVFVDGLRWLDGSQGF